MSAALSRDMTQAPAEPARAQPWHDRWSVAGLPDGEGGVAAAQLRRFARHLRGGDPFAALQAASAACQAAPDAAQAHFAYGEAWLALNQPPCAEPAFAAAVRLAPDWSDAWINLGIARFRQGAIDGARQAMREALRRVPGHPVASAKLASFLAIAADA